jgi:hypothetical protein
VQRPDAPNVGLELGETSLVHELCVADAVGVRPSVELVEARDFVVVGATMTFPQRSVGISVASRSSFSRTISRASACCVRN